MSECVPARLRRLVQRRSGRRCEYCLLPEGREAFLPHELDHIRALQHGGETVESNLAWACPTCNIQKGPNLASIDPETGKMVRLFNPRKDDWSKHFRLEREYIIPLTSVGRVTEFLLKFNREDRLDTRRLLIEADLFPTPD